MKTAVWILAAAAIFVVAVGLGAWWVKGHLFSCGDAEAAEILHSLPGAAGFDVDSDVSGDCHLEYETSEPMEEFIPALAAHLEARGWKVTSEREIPTNVVRARRGRGRSLWSTEAMHHRQAESSSSTRPSTRSITDL